MTNLILLQQPIVQHQIGEADKCAVLLEEAARNLRERASNDPLIFRVAAVVATDAARELNVTAGMLELVEVAP
jgi:hypothetical protein